MRFDRRRVVFGGMALVAGCNQPVRAQGSGPVFRPEDFGARGNGVANDTLAFAALAAAVNRAGGGTIELRRGATYIVGIQSAANDGQWMFRPRTIFHIQGCRLPVALNGNGGKIRFAPGLRYGTFARSGAAASFPLPYTNPTTRAAPALEREGMITFSNNRAAVTISDLELDGNAAAFRLGGPFGDHGFQLPGDGLMLFDNSGGVTVRNLFAHHMPRDGCMILDGSNRPDGRFENCRFDDNGRQGLSLVGGAGYLFHGCSFRRNGQGRIYSAPGAGVDLEAETAPIRRIRFEDCEFSDNRGVGLLADSGDVAEVEVVGCRLVGTVAWSAWPNKPRMVFTNCTFLGALTHAWADADRRRATQFVGCTFSDDPSLSPRRLLVGAGTSLIDFNAGGTNVLFDRCRIDAGRQSNAASVGAVIIRDCTITVRAPRGYAFLGTVFEGHTVVNSPAAGLGNMPGAVIRGAVTINGVTHRG